MNFENLRRTLRLAILYFILINYDSPFISRRHFSNGWFQIEILTNKSFNSIFQVERAELNRASKFGS